MNATGINRKNRSSLKYSNLQTARRPIIADFDEIPVHVCGERFKISDEDSSSVQDDKELVPFDDAMLRMSFVI